jgi:putative ABC transport system ATP-binding protein
VELLRATRLTKIYAAGNHQVLALQDVDLTAAAGEMVALVGPSGSGKSTLLALLGGLERPTSGSVSLLGTDYSQLSEEALTRLRRRSIGYIFQSFNLIPGLTAAENVALTARLDGRRITAEEVDEALRAVGLAHRKHHRATELSGGEQQRVAIARALLSRPPLILADEPTASLDSATGATILSLLRKAVENGQTVILVTHDMQAASQADRIIYLRDGAIVGQEQGGNRRVETGGSSLAHGRDGR